MKNSMDNLAIFEENIFNSFLNNHKGIHNQDEAMKYLLLQKGKRIRPRLVFESCKAVNGDCIHAVNFAKAIEYIHTYSLIHDDLPCMDNDEFRRGVSTTHIMFGEANALLAGDALLNLASEQGFSTINSYAESSNYEMLVRQTKAFNYLFKASGREGMIGGQYCDIANNGDSDLETLNYININKTGKLFAAALYGGSMIGMGDERLSETLGEIGLIIGQIFQIRDDILDITGKTEIIGKPVGSDEGRGMKTYPQILGINESKAYAEKLLNKIKEKFFSLNIENTILWKTFEELMIREK